MSSAATSSSRIDHILRSMPELSADSLKKLEQLLLETITIPSALDYPPLPDWFEAIKRSSDDVILVDTGVHDVDRDEDWRLNEGGYSGTDLIHSSSRAPCRVLEYCLLPSVSDSVTTDSNDIHPRLIGCAYFSEAAEGHKGLIHGGAMCALMDDCIGWMGFCSDLKAGPRPWSGFTVQIDTTLKKPVKVGSLLQVEAWIEKREGPRKVWVGCRLVDPSSPTETVHCTARGLFLLSPEFVSPVTENSATKAKL